MSCVDWYFQYVFMLICLVTPSLLSSMWTTFFSLCLKLAILWLNSPVLYLSSTLQKLLRYLLMSLIKHQTHALFYWIERCMSWLLSVGVQWIKLIWVWEFYFKALIPEYMTNLCIMVTFHLFYSCIRVWGTCYRQEENWKWIFQFNLKVKICFVLEKSAFHNCAFDEWKSI